MRDILAGPLVTLLPRRKEGEDCLHTGIRKAYGNYDSGEHNSYSRYSFHLRTP